MDAVSILFDELSGQTHYIGVMFGLLGIACLWLLPVIFAAIHCPKYTKAIVVLNVVAFFITPMWVGLLVLTLLGRQVEAVLERSQCYFRRHLQRHLQRANDGQTPHTQTQYLSHTKTQQQQASVAGHLLGLWFVRDNQKWDKK
ncbi:hypothetical protein JCM19237_4632 [Photobacterium aphoticum]|uniref:Superinfection immunity protein n=1 Tax=Photobacterium aphoticum TaxID=754436 RepID=A0A090QWE3_9GAMM|nr:hypothetical protein JCM19237_4632 [Photobacterium aphoticum]